MMSSNSVSFAIKAGEDPNQMGTSTELNQKKRKSESEENSDNVSHVAKSLRSSEGLMLPPSLYQKKVRLLKNGSLDKSSSRPIDPIASPPTPPLISSPTSDKGFPVVNPIPVTGPSSSSEMESQANSVSSTLLSGLTLLADASSTAARSVLDSVSTIPVIQPTPHASSIQALSQVQKPGMVLTTDDFTFEVIQTMKYQDSDGKDGAPKPQIGEKAITVCCQLSEQMREECDLYNPAMIESWRANATLHNARTNEEIVDCLEGPYIRSFRDGKAVLEDLQIRPDIVKKINIYQDHVYLQINFTSSAALNQAIMQPMGFDKVSHKSPNFNAGHYIIKRDQPQNRMQSAVQAPIQRLEQPRQLQQQFNLPVVESSQVEQPQDPTVRAEDFTVVLIDKNGEPPLQYTRVTKGNTCSELELQISLTDDKAWKLKFFDLTPITVNICLRRFSNNEKIEDGLTNDGVARFSKNGKVTSSFKISYEAYGNIPERDHTVYLSVNFGLSLKPGEKAPKTPPGLGNVILTTPSFVVGTYTKARYQQMQASKKQ